MGRKTCYNTAEVDVGIIAFYDHLHGIFNGPIMSQMSMLSLLS